jgi:MFS family permease
MGLSWQLGFIIGPAAGGAVLGTEPLALWPIMASLSLVGALYALRLERFLQAEVRRNPRREEARRFIAFSGSSFAAAVSWLGDDLLRRLRLRGASGAGAAVPSRSVRCSHRRYSIY